MSKYNDDKCLRINKKYYDDLEVNKMRVKTKKQAVIRTIYNNYNLWEDSKDDAIETLKANDITITDSAIWEEIYNQDEYDWIGIKDDLERFFNGESTWILQ